MPLKRIASAFPVSLLRDKQANMIKDELLALRYPAATGYLHITDYH